MKKIIKNKFMYIILLGVVFLVLIGVYIFNNKNIIEAKNYNEFIKEENKVEELEIKKEETNINEEIKKVRVDIKGYINNPGVYEILENSKVIDVINIAGGLKENADTSRVNLAKTVKDEMVIIIYSKSEIDNYIKSQNKVETIVEYKYVEKPCECPTVNDACLKEEDLSANQIKEEIKSEDKIEDNKQEENKIISINNGTKEELMTLPSIGEAKANSIIEYREKNKFEKIDDIKNVSGIGESLFEKIKDYITI